jgi:hypothetical protein
VKAEIRIADSATPELRRIAQQLKNPVALYKDVGNSVADPLRDHCIANDSTPNKRGGRVPADADYYEISRSIGPVVPVHAVAAERDGDQLHKAGDDNKAKDEVHVTSAM